MQPQASSSSIFSRLKPHRKASTPTSIPAESPVPDEMASSVMSSCEIFSMFKTLAAGRPSRKTSKVEQSSEPSSPVLEPLASNEKGLSLEIPAASPLSMSPTATPESETPSVEPSCNPISEAAKTSKEDKIKAIQEEYGDIASDMQDVEGNTIPEELVAECGGAMFKGIMMVGNIHLTTHRLLFHALLPPDEAFVRHYDSAEQFETVGSGPIDKSYIIHAGPVTWHRHKPLTPSQRVWMELNGEMITTYPSADEAGRVRPIKSFLLSSIISLKPLDPNKPADLHLTHQGEDFVRTYSITVDTPQSASLWRRNIEAALFRILRTKWRHNASDRLHEHLEGGADQWNTLRYCVPLDRVIVRDIGDYHEFATLVGITAELDEHKKLLFHTDKILEGDFLAASQLLPPTEELKRMSMDSDHTRVQASPTFEFNLAIISDQAHFVSELHKAIDNAHGRHPKLGSVNHQMKFTIAGVDCLVTDEDLDLAEPEEEQPAESLPAKVARKAAKGHLAAKAFGLHEEEGIWLKRCYVDIAGVPIRGHLILTPRYVCFWRRNTLTPDVKYRFERNIVKGFEPVSCTQPGFSGLALKLHGQHDVVFEFWNKDGRDEAIERIKDILGSDSSQTPLVHTPSSTESFTHPTDVLLPTKKALFESRIFPDDFLSHMPFIANKPWMSRSFSISPRTFTMLTIGSRGDVQPYIALGLRLKQDGHRVVIVTHDEFKTWVEGYGLEHRQAGGDPTALMKLSQEHKMLSPGFFKESVGYFRQWLDDLLVDAWEACKDADVLIESPSAMAGIHIAERLQIPYFRAFTMPWTRTTAYPQAFMVPAFEMGPSFNYSTYVIYDNIIWKATAPQINRWRKKYLELGPTDMSALSPTKVPFLYNFSSAVVPKPLDWHDDIAITGYWVLENSDSEWSPPDALVAFMDKAKADGKALVYIGFGSIVVPKPDEMTRNIIQAVEKADVRAIIAKGWSSRGGDPAKEGEAIEFPDSCFGLDKVPHGWLFPRVQAAMHHGGAGTVGASLRAGVPTLIKPWFGDQYFWANRVNKLGVGLRVSSLRADDIAEALTKATTDRVMTEKAARIGEAIRKESGVDNALEAIHYNILRAGSDRTKMSWAK